MTASAEPLDGAAPAWTVDELAAETGVTVRNIRYYLTLGLLPAPTRRGRMAYFDERHRARIGLVQAMQDGGLSLAAIEQHLAHLPPTASANEIEMRRALFTSWTPLPEGPVARHELESRAGRPLSSEDLATLELLGSVRSTPEGFVPRPTFEVGVQLLELDIPVDSMEAAGEAIRHHMSELVQELREIMRTRVIAPMRQRNTDLGSAEFAATMTRLRLLTFNALVGNFQQAMGELVDVGATAAAEDRE